jgi:hypothetical protein
MTQPRDRQAAATRCFCEGFPAPSVACRLQFFPAMLALALAILFSPAAATAVVPGSIHSPPCSGGAVRWEVRGERGVVLEAGGCEAGKPEGRWVYRHENGVIAAEGTFSAGERDGRWIFRFQDGSVASEGTYVDGVEDGFWLERTEAGETEEGAYRFGERVGSWNVRAADGSQAEVDYAGGEPAALHAAGPR